MPRALRLLAAVAVAAAALLATGCGVGSQRGRWNVVVVLVDTLRADRLGAYGYDRPTSPRFDALAAGSYLFTDARAQASCTYPSVNSILTSRYPARFLGQPGGRLGIPDDVPTIASILAGQGFATAAVSSSAVVRATPGELNPTGGFGAGFQRFDEECQLKDGDCVHDRTTRILAGLPEPFFLYLHYLDPHAPYAPPRELRERFVRGTTQQRWVRRGNPNPIGEAIYDGRQGVTWQDSDVAYLQDLYDAEVAAFDGYLGQLEDELRRRGLLDRTVFALVADHGESFLEHGHVKHCRTVYEAEIKTPFLLRLPRQREGRRIGGAVQNLDLVPTLVDLLDLPVEGRGFEGVSLLPLLEGDEPGERLSYAMIAAQRSVTDGRHKVIHDLRAGTWQLFDVAADPGERRDVLRAARGPFGRLRPALLSWLGRTEGEGGLQRAEEAERRLKAVGYL
jgi:arylsulfatase